MTRPAVLLADDDAQFRAAMRVRLQSMGYEVVESANCVDVLAKGPSGWASAILLDHDMPGGSGCATAKVIREHTDVPIIFISGHGSETFKSVVNLVPNVYYVPKPVDSARLERLLRLVTQGETDSTESNGEATGRPAESAARAGKPDQKPLVLVADDDAAMRQAIRLRLVSAGYDVEESGDGLGAIAKARAHEHHAIVLDHDMPLGEGMTVAHNLRRLTDTPIVFVSGHDRERFRETVQTLASTYFLPKPLDADRLISLIHSFGARKETAECLRS